MERTSERDARNGARISFGICHRCSTGPGHGSGLLFALFFAHPSHVLTRRVRRLRAHLGISMLRTRCASSRNSFLFFVDPFLFASTPMRQVWLTMSTSGQVSTESFDFSPIVIDPRQFRYVDGRRQRALICHAIHFDYNIHRGFG